MQTYKSLINIAAEAVLAKICILTNLLSLVFYAIQHAQLAYLTVFALLVECRQEFKLTCNQALERAHIPVYSIIIKMLLILFVMYVTFLVPIVTVLLLVFALVVIII